LQFGRQQPYNNSVQVDNRRLKTILCFQGFNYEKCQNFQRETISKDRIFTGAGEHVPLSLNRVYIHRFVGRQISKCEHGFTVFNNHDFVLMRAFVFRRDSVSAM